MSPQGLHKADIKTESAAQLGTDIRKTYCVEQNPVSVSLLLPPFDHQEADVEGGKRCNLVIRQ